ncbi:type II toxin-antitoxin system prevent-host-death family antitoxin [Nocardia sp. NEAU-G5]|uniref:Type II toxin-antitoxin system prevent-host-death family antitoxin n=1 Tax=Nocardia albiluteola TaxID=2842303 RepID=A0ABS6B1L6_9NOCA|nr:type II toxin-antitoxin system prevent-host-death family antitoxin [Nocardia albiluteola]MBU3064188.1 type II toxin-antitoxin system prevent-host-death family antitoxin [Nocardia albiluteola]
MKSISVGELRQNPAEMIADVEAGEVYELTKHSQRVGFIVPATSSAHIIAPRKGTGGARTRRIARHELRSAATIDELLESEKGEW